MRNSSGWIEPGTFRGMGNDKVVWVLGSGFSRSLGGPLLDELMERSRFERVMAWQPDEFKNLHDPWKNLVDTFLGKKKKEKRRRPWRDAEEFIEMIELARLGDAAGQRMMDLRMLGQQPTEAAPLARRYLAAVTHEFVDGADAGLERWQPYRAWAAQLQRSDHVISFNYDLVVERAYVAATEGDEEISRTTNKQEGQLHKVHGSVEWSFYIPDGRNDEVSDTQDVMRIITNGNYEPAIGVPGPGKMSSCTTAFRPMWQAATAALQNADVIVFVGYRFPPSDSYAKMTLLQAIRENKQDVLTLRLVLGPKRSDDVARLEGLLQWALRGRAGPFELIHEPLLAEDFLAVFDRSLIGRVKPSEA